MISKFDLYDLSAALILIRSEIKHNTNINVLKNIVKVLYCVDQPYEDNQIRKSIAAVENLNRDKWYFVFHDNVYMNYRLLKNKHIYIILSTACEELIQLLKDKKYERAYDLVDCIHCLPDIIADNNFTITKSYWKTNLHCYRKNWNNNFLKIEQKSIKKNIFK